MKPAEHKHLTAEATRIRILLTDLKGQMVNLEAQVKSKEKSLKKIQDKIALATNSKMELVVSEHALIRFLERVNKVDISATAQQIRADLNAIGASTDGKYLCGNYSAQVRNGVVVTIHE